MLGAYVSSDLEIESLAAHVPLHTTLGKQHFTKQLLHPTTDVLALKKIQTPLLALRRFDCSPLHEALTTFQTIEPVFQEFQSSLDPLVEESTEQIVWNPSTLAGRLCNQSPLLLNSLIAWKTIALPTITIISPLLAVLIPYIVLYMNGIQPPLQEYLTTVRSTIRGAITIPSILQSKGEHDRIGFIFESVYICIMIGICLSSVWTQVTNALHLRTIATSLCEKGTLLRTGITAANSIYTALSNSPTRIRNGIRDLLAEGKRVLEPFQTTTDTGLGLFARMWKDSSSLVAIHTWIGTLDAHVAIASLTNICFPRWSSSAPHIELKNVIHPFLPHPVANNFTIKTGAILTGPNRGGKSTFCKAVGLSILCAQTWGFAFATQATLTPFARIETALSPADTLGRVSLFEAEIEFAKSVVEASEQPMFVMMDEIFHSTNAHDGVEASRVFLHSLYARPTTLSLISTHYRSLAEEFSQTTPLQAETIPQKEGTLSYTYKILPGISTASSVMEILREKGLLKTLPPSTET
jgi:hypothetical protein